MKKFFAKATKGVFATTVPASNVLSTEGLATELVRTALVEGKNFVISGDEKVAAEVQEQFMTSLNDMLNAAEEIGNTDSLDQFKENGHLSKEVYEWLLDTLEARKNKVLDVAIPTEEVVIAKGINMKPQQVLQAMAARGLTIGGECKFGDKEGKVLGFEISAGGTIAVVMFAEGPLKVLVNDRLVGLATVASVAQATANTNTQSKGDVSTMKNVKAQSAVEVALRVLGGIDPAVKTAVEEALASGAAPYDLSPEQRDLMQQHKLATDLVKFAAKQEEKTENASKVANSAEADALLAVLGATPAASTPAANAQAQAPASQGAPVVDPAVAVASAKQNTNQNNGGNVQVNTQTQGAQTPPIATPAANAIAGRQSATGMPSLAAGMTGVPSLAPGVGGTAQQSAVMSAWEAMGIKDQFAAIVGEDDQYMGRNANGQTDYVWYMEEAKKYEDQIMTGSELVANGMKNAALGITDIQFYNPIDVAKARGGNFQPRPEEYKYAEVFFGMTSYEFLIRKGAWTDEKNGITTPFINSSNILRKKRETTGTYFCEYQSNRRSDVLDVVVQSDGKVRLARKAWNPTERAFTVIAEDKAFVQQVGGGKNYVTTPNSWSVKIGQAAMIQVLVLFDELVGLRQLRDTRAAAIAAQTAQK